MRARLDPDLAHAARVVIKSALESGVVDIPTIAEATGIKRNTVYMFARGEFNASVKNTFLMLQTVERLPGAPPGVADLRQKVAAFGMDAPQAAPQLPLALPPGPPAPGSFPGAALPRVKNPPLLKLRVRFRELLAVDGDRIALARRAGVKAKVIERVVTGGSMPAVQAARILARLDAPNGPVSIQTEMAAPIALALEAPHDAPSTVARAQALVDRMRREALEYVLRIAKGSEPKP